MSRRASLRLVEASAVQAPRLVRSDYYHGRTLVKSNRGRWPLRAAERAVYYLRTNRYEATHVEVFSEETGKLYSVVKRSMNGDLHILFETKYNAAREEAIKPAKRGGSA